MRLKVLDVRWPNVLAVLSGITTGGSTLAATLAGTIYIGIMSQSGILSSVVMVGGCALTTFLGMYASEGGYKLGCHYDNHSKRKKLFEIEKSGEIENLKGQLANFEKTSPKYEKGYVEGDFVFVKDEGIGYSVGYIQTERVVQEWLNQKGDEVKIKKKIEPEKVLCVLTPSHTLSKEDVKALEEETPVYCEWNGRVEFGFVKVGEEGFELYVDKSCKLRSPTSFDEMEELVVRKLVPKFVKRDHPYR